MTVTSGTYGIIAFVLATRVSPRLPVVRDVVVGVVVKTVGDGFLYGLLVTVTSGTYGMYASVIARRVSSRLPLVSDVVVGVVDGTAAFGFSCSK